MFDPFYFAALGAGILSFLSPCILPLIPSYISFITGASLTQLQNSRDSSLRKKTIISSLLFIGGFSFVFVALGASASFIGEVLQQYQQWISRIGGIFIILMGLYLTGFLKIPFLARERKIHLTRTPIRYWGIPLVGAVFAAGWTPCVGPILGSILFYASSTASVGKGVLLLSLYSAGLAIPFFISSVSLSFFLDKYGAVNRHMRLISYISGGLLVGMGILLVSDIFPYVSFRLSSFGP